MAKANRERVSNRLLRVLSDADFQLVADYLEFIDLPRQFALSHPNKPSSYVYFLESGICSVVALSPTGRSAEIGIFGRDGMAPATASLQGGSDPYATFMQVSGNGYRVGIDDFNRLLGESHTLRATLSRFAQAHFVQAGYTALSNAVHQIDERLARWILMCHDRSDGDEIALTHEFLSAMLGVRRPSVTTALHFLEGKRYIFAERGLITVRNRRSLELFASDAYGVPEREYLRLIGQMK